MADRKSHKKAVAPGRKSASNAKEDLRPGWIRVESRSKPGAFFYAHPLTKRTQVERPVVLQGPLPGPSILDVETESQREIQVAMAEDRRRAEQEARRQAAEEAAATEAARVEEVRQARVAKKALERAVVAEEVEGAAEREEEPVTKEELEKWRLMEERREREEAERERERKEADARKAQEEERRRDEERRQRKDNHRKLRENTLEMERKEAQYEEALAAMRRRSEEEARSKVREELLNPTSTPGAMSSKSQPPHASASRAQPAERVGERAPSQVQATCAQAPYLGSLFPLGSSTGDANAKRQRIPEPTDLVSGHCFDVFKMGVSIGRHMLSGVKQSWIFGRAPPDQVDIPMNHDTISRKHATVTRQGMFMFLSDLGSAHGTIVDGQRLQKLVPVRLCRGANISFGGSTRIYVYREPALMLDPSGRLHPPASGAQNAPPPLDSPRASPHRDLLGVVPPAPQPPVPALNSESVAAKEVAAPAGDEGHAPESDVHQGLSEPTAATKKSAERSQKRTKRDSTSGGRSGKGSRIREKKNPKLARKKGASTSKAKKGTRSKSKKKTSTKHVKKKERKDKKKAKKRSSSSSPASSSTASRPPKAKAPKRKRGKKRSASSSSSPPAASSPSSSADSSGGAARAERRRAAAALAAAMG